MLWVENGGGPLLYKICLRVKTEVLFSDMALGPAPKDLLTCSYNNCFNRLLARSLCGKHYQEAYRSNTLPAKLAPKPTRKKVVLKTYVTLEVETILTALARKTGQTNSEILRGALEKYLKEGG